MSNCAKIHFNMSLHICRYSVKMSDSIAHSLKKILIAIKFLQAFEIILNLALETIFSLL